MIMRNVGSDSSSSLRALVALLALFALAVPLFALVGCSSPAASGAPSIGTQPAAVTVAEGAVASFTVAAAGDPTLAYPYSNLCPAGKTWGVGSTIDDAGGNSSDPRIAIAASGTAVAAFSQTPDAAGGLSRTWAARFTGGWAAPKAVDTGNGSPSEEPRAALGADGSTLVAFVQPDGTQPRVRVASWTASMTWAPPRCSMSEAAGSRSSPSLPTDTRWPRG